MICQGEMHMNNKLKWLINSKICMFMFLFIIVGIFSLRMINLDRDLPAWGVGYYQPIDEGSYSILSLNKINHNTINPNNLQDGLSFYTPSHVRTNIIGNIATYVGLNTVGDNYYGLRLPYVFICLINFCLITLVLFQLRKKYGLKTLSEIWIILLGLLYLAVDFPFTLAARVVEPSTVRLLFVLITVLIFLLFDGKNRLKYFLIGFIITTSVFAVYITNVFLILAVGIVLIYIWSQEGYKRFLQYLSFFVFGCVLSLGICEGYYILFWNTEAILNMFGALFDFSSVSAYSGASGMRTVIRTFIRFFSSNELFYNAPILFGVVFSLPLLFRRFIIKKDTNILFLVSIIVSFLLQTLASEDYIIRKSIVTYPVFVFLLYLGYLFRMDWQKIDNTIIEKTALLLANYERKISNDTKPSNRKISKFGMGLFGIFKIYKFSQIALIISVLFSFIMVLYRTILCHPDLRIDYTLTDKLILFIFLLIPYFVISLKLIWIIIKKEYQSTKYNLSVIGVTFIFSFLVNIYFSISYIYLNPTFSEKNIMIELQKDAGDNYVLGEYENGFTLYNNIKPVLNTYDQLKKFMESNTDLLYFDYYDEFDSGMRNFFDNTLFEDSNYTILPIKVYPREFQTYGIKKKLALYHIVTKKEAAQYYKTYLRDLEEKKVLSEEEITYLDKLSESYKDIRNTITTDIMDADIYADIYGNIEGSIYSDIYGDIYGDISGSIYGNIYGDIYGDINGNVYGHIYGKIYGKMKGYYFDLEGDKGDSDENN
jgi:hypothetical protein